MSTRRKKTTAQREAEQKRSAVMPVAKKRLSEERKWASRSGPVTTRQATPEELARTRRKK